VTGQPQGAGAAASGASDSLAHALQALVRRHLGPAARVVDLKALSGGASAGTWQFDALTGDARLPLILQRAAGTEQFEASLDRSLQGRVQAAAFSAGLPVAEVLFVCDAADELGSGYVMRRIEGETLGARILRLPEYAAARAILTRQCGETLARIHALNAARLPPLPLRDAAENLDAMRSVYRRGAALLPVFELALQWLEDHLPEPVTTTLVHGDFRLGNLIVGAEGLRAVLDWEMAHVGDPAEDLAWISVPSWRFGRVQNEVGGFGTLADLTASYRSAGGRAVDPARIRFWQVLGALKWGLVCQFFARQHLKGDVRSVERAVIGRRTSETELDLLMLIRGG
jgi:aminoglycoside phosphotransferase (APT) family kinase protein